MELSQCPSHEQLVEFDLGKIPGELCERIHAHLDQCVICSAEIVSLGDNADEFVAALREKLPPEIIHEDSELISLMELAAAMSLTENIEATDTKEVRPGSKKPPLDQIIEQILIPAETDDELGRLGGYRVRKVLGVGGMGIVFKAEDPLFKREVALKAMLPHVASASESARNRFLREAQTAASIHHDHIVTIFQVGEDREIPFLAMEFLPGESLATRLSREKSLPIVEAMRIAYEMALGLSAAHTKGLVHRDIKPDNVWIEAGNDRVKILDFGLARGVQDAGELTETGAVVGTPQYLAPEQADGQAVDQRADLFSVGVVLYRLITGVSPFARGTLLSTLKAIGTEIPEAPHRLRDGVTRELSQLVMDLLEKAPSKRIDSAETLIDRLKGLMDGKPLTAANDQRRPRRMWMTGGV